MVPDSTYGAAQMPNQKPLYLADFMTGLFAALAQQNAPPLSLRENRFCRAVKDAFDHLEQEAEAYGVELRFYIEPHPIHGTDPDLDDELTEAAKRNLISLDNPEYQDIRLKIEAGDAPRYLKRVPGSPQMYLRLAEIVLAKYNAA